MTRAPAPKAPIAAALAGLALTACVATPSENKDVVAVVQDEQSRQAAGDEAQAGKPADAALSEASEARTPATDPPH
jgi:hypothetical protein